MDKDVHVKIKEGNIMIINHNMMAMNANRMANINSNSAAKSMAKLSSGLRINSAADDAAGLAISEKMKGQINGLDQASSNAQNGISLVQTAEGALNETTSILQRMRELAVQSANDTNTADDRSALQTEVTQLTSEIDRIANTTEFNTKKLLNGSSGLNVADGTIVGNASTTAATKQGTYTVNATAATLATAATTATLTADTAGATVTASGTVTVNGVTITVGASDTYQDVADKINASVSGVTADFSGAGSTLCIKTNDVGAAQSLKISDSAAGMFGVDFNTAAVTYNGTNASGLTDTNFGTGATCTYNGNTVSVHGGIGDGLTFKLLSKASNTTITVNGSLTLQIGANANQTMGVSISAMGAQNLGVANLDVTTQTGAEAALDLVDKATSSVSSERAKLGAYQNRLEHTINNLGTASQNLTSAQSQIADVDIAKEIAEYSKNNVLSQAAQAMLAQANQQSQQVLQLLR
jgi:flagellin